MLVKNLIILVTFILFSVQFAHAKIVKAKIDDAISQKIEKAGKTQPIKRTIAETEIKENEREISSIKGAESEVRFWTLEEAELAVDSKD